MVQKDSLQAVVPTGPIEDETPPLAVQAWSHDPPKLVPSKVRAPMMSRNAVEEHSRQSSVDTVEEVVVDDGVSQHHRQISTSSDQQMNLRPSRQMRTTTDKVLRSQKTRELDFHHNEPRMLTEVGKRKHQKKRRKAVLDFLMGTRPGQFLILVMVGASLVGLGAIVWSNFGGNGDYDTSVVQSVWLSWGLFFDPGTQTGIPATDPGSVMMIAVAFSFMGFVFNLTLLGLLVDIVRSTLTKWMKKRDRFVKTGHTLVLGWTDKTLYLLREKLVEASIARKKLTILILADRDQTDMSQEVDEYFDGELNGSCVVCRTGKPFDPKALSRVSVGSAQDIIVLGRSFTSRSSAPATARESDLEVLRVLAALGCLDEKINGRLIAEVRQGDTTPVMEAFVPNAEGVFARGAVDKMLALVATRPELGILYSMFCSFGDDGAEFYAKRIPGLIGSTFGEARKYYDRAVAVAIKSPGRKMEFAPADSREIEPDDKVLFLASGVSAFCAGDKSSRGSAGEQPGNLKNQMSQSAERLVDGVHGVLDETDNAFQFVTDHVRRMPKRLIYGKSELLPTKTDWSAAQYVHHEPDVTIFILAGWPADGADILKAIGDNESCAPMKSEVHILSKKGEESQKDMRNIPERLLQRIKVTHHYGARTDASALRKLPLRTARTILVLAENQTSSGMCIDTMTSDTESLACGTMIAAIADGKYGGDIFQLEGQMVCEILDARTDRLLKKNTTITSRCIFFRSNAIEMGMFAMASSEPVTYNTLVTLLMPNNPAYLRSESVEDILDSTLEGDSLSDKRLGFQVRRLSVETGMDSQATDEATDEAIDDPVMVRRDIVQITVNVLVERVRQKGGVLIGWQCTQHEPELMTSVAMTDWPCRWLLTDRLLVIRSPRITEELDRTLARGGSCSRHIGDYEIV